MASKEITRFTDVLSESINKLYKTGGFALSFGFAGILMMLLAKLFGQEDARLLITIGAVLTFSCLTFFLYASVKGNQKAAAAVSQNKDTIDALQDISIQLTRLTRFIQAYGFKNIEQINSVVEKSISALKAVPFVGDIVTKYKLDSVSVISQALVENTEKVESIVTDIEKALIDADHRKLKQYSMDLSEAVQKLRNHLME
jgi:hypothetical protein